MLNVVLGKLHLCIFYEDTKVYPVGHARCFRGIQKGQNVSDDSSPDYRVLLTCSAVLHSKVLQTRVLQNAPVRSRVSNVQLGIPSLFLTLKNMAGLRHVWLQSTHIYIRVRLTFMSTTYHKKVSTHRVHASLVNSTQQSQQSERNRQKLAGNHQNVHEPHRTIFPFFQQKRQALILTQEGKEYLYSDVVRIHEI